MSDYAKNDVITVTIEDMGTDGEGIGKLDGFTFFIKDAVIGDVVEAKVMKAKKNYAYARLLRILTPSKQRIQPVCEFHKQCGGCQIQALDYQAQLAFKENGQTIAYISNQSLVITNAEIRYKLSLGTEDRGWFDFIPRSSGNLSIVWRGAETS